MWSLFLAPALAFPPSAVLGLESWAPLDGHPLFPPHLIPGGWPLGTVVGPDGCPEAVDIDVCGDDRFWETTCGARALTREDTTAACLTAFEAYAKREHASLDQVTVVNARTGEPTVVRFEDYVPQRIQWDGFDASFQRHLLALANPRDGNEALGASLQLAWWDQNCSVQSCEELAHEAFDDYAELEVRLLGHLRDGDYGAVYDEAYGSDGVARLPLYSSAGELLPPLALDRSRSFIGAYNTFAGASGRGAIYGFSPEQAQLTHAPLSRIPFLVRALGDVSADFPGEVPVDETVLGDFLLSFENQCPMSPSSGLLVCSGATPLQESIAAAFNARLWDQSAAPLASIPADEAWPPPGQSSWDFHQSMHDQLAGESDDRLIWLEERMLEASRLVGERKQLWDRIGALALSESLRGVVECGDVPPQSPLACPDGAVEGPEVFGRLWQVDQRLEALVRVFDDAGCLADAPTACDWSPRWFSHALVGHFAESRDALYRECVARTGNDFSDLMTPDDASEHWLQAEDALQLAHDGTSICDVTTTRTPGLRCEVRDDYLRDDGTVRSYFQTVDAWGRAFAERWDFPVDPDTGQPDIGGSSSDAARIGDTRFGVQLAYDTGWNLGPIENLPSDLALSAHGQLQVETVLFGHPIPAAYAGTETEIDDEGLFASSFDDRRRRGNLAFVDLYASNANGGDAWAVMDLLGSELYRNVGGTDDPDHGVTFHYVAQPGSGAGLELTEELARVESTVFVGPVPLELLVGASGSVGVVANASLTATQSADTAAVNTQLLFEPYVRASVFAEARAGVSGFLSAGVAADLTLVEVGLPVTADLEASAGPEESRLEVELGASLRTTLLAGRVRGFVETPWKDYQTTLFRYDGIQLETPLASTAFDADLVRIQQAFGIVAGDAPTETRDDVSATSLIIDRGVCEDDPRIPTPDLYFDFDDENLHGDQMLAAVGAGALELGTAQVGREGLHGQAVGAAGGVLSNDAATDVPLDGSFSSSLWFAPDGEEGTVLSLGEDGAGLSIHQVSFDAIDVVAACAEGPQTRRLQLLREPTWHHLYLRYDAQGTLQVQADDASTGLLCTLDSLDDLHLGALVAAGGVMDPWLGRLDELGVWGQALPVDTLAQLRTQGAARLPLAGSGSAPLAGVQDVQGSLEDGGTLVTLDLSWTLPPSLDEQGYGYDSVVVRVDPHAPVETIDGGTQGYVGEADTTSFFLPQGTQTAYVSTWATGPAGVKRGPRSVFQLPVADLPQVQSAVARPLDHGVRLSWNLPTDPRVVAVRVVRSTGPIDGPEDGALVYVGAGEGLDDLGLANDVPVTYTLWTVGADGALGLPIEVSTTPTAGAVLDTVAPAALVSLDAVATAGQVSLSWTFPADVDPLQARIRRVDGGFFRRHLGTHTGSTFLDPGVSAETDYRYEVSVVDPSGNEGPVTAIDVRTDGIEGPSLFTATVVDLEVELTAVLPDVPGAEWVVRRTDGAIASSPFEGAPVCAGGLEDACVDTSPPLDTPLRYTAFVVHEGAHSAPAPSALIQVSSTGAAGPDRTVFVGERVDLEAIGLDGAGSWSGPRDLVVDATGTWWIPRTPATVEVQVVGELLGNPTSDTAVITAVPYAGPTTTVEANPFSGNLLAGEGVRGLYPRLDDMVAWTSDGSLLALDDDSVTPLATCDDVVELEGELLICRTATELQGVDLTTGLQVFSLPAPSGAWLGDLRGGVLAYATSVGFDTVQLSMALVDLGGSTPLGELVLTGTQGFASELVLDETGSRVLVSTFNHVTRYGVLGQSGSISPADQVVVDDFGAVGIAWQADRLLVAVQRSVESDAIRVYDTSEIPMVELREEVAPPGLHRAEAMDGFVVVGEAAVAAYDLAGLAIGEYTGASWEPGSVAVRDDEVWVAARPGAGLGGDRVVVHPRSQPRLSDEPSRVLDPVDAGLSVIEAMAVGQGAWAARSFDQLLVGDANGLRWQGTLGFSAAPYELSQMLCMDEQAVHYVTDVGGVPSLQQAPLAAGSFEPGASWPLPVGCTAGLCSEEGPLLVCGTDLVLYATDGVELDRRAIPAGLELGTLLDAGDGALLSSFGPGGEDAAAVWAEHGALEVSPVVTLPTSVGGVVVEDQLLLPGAPATQTDLQSGITTTFPGWDVTWIFDHDRATGQLTGLGDDSLVAGTTAGLVSGALVPSAFTLVSEDGLSLLDSGSALFQVSIAPLSVRSEHHQVFAGDDLVTEVRWTGQPTLGLTMQCQATTGPCEVLSFNPFSQVATIGWTAGDIPGEHALTVFAGTHRWFTSGTDRILVEAP